MMKTRNGFDYAFNAQAVVDEKSQVVLAGEVTQEAGDVNQLVPMIEKTEENLAAAGIDGAPEKLLTDAGYCSEDNLEAAEDLGPDVLVATGRQRRGEKFQKTPRGPVPKGATRRERMARRLRTKKGRADYALEKGDRRTGFRADEGPPARRSAPLARSRGGAGRVDPPHDLPQPAQARQRWTNGDVGARLRRTRCPCASANFVPPPIPGLNAM